MQVDLFKSYFTLQCDLETDGRAWAYLNEFMCIGKNKNNYFVSLTTSIPIEMIVSDGGKTLTILKEKDLFSGRRPSAQSILQFTLKHWKKQAFLDIKRETTGCLLLPNMGRKDLENDKNTLQDIVKKAMPEVRALWQVQSLGDYLNSFNLNDNRLDNFWLQEFPVHWILLFGCTISVSSGSLETNQYTRETLEFDLDLTPMLSNFTETHTQSVPISTLNHNYISNNSFGLKIFIDTNLSNHSLQFRIEYNISDGKRESQTIELSISSDHVDKQNPEPKQYVNVDRLVLSLPDESENLINIIVKDNQISDSVAKIFDRNAGISVRLDRFLGRR